MSLLVVYYTFLQHTLNKPEDSCCFACSTDVVLHALVVAVCIVVVVAAIVVVDGVVVAAIAQLRVDKNMLDANYEEGDIGDFQDAFDDGKNP